MTKYGVEQHKIPLKSHHRSAGHQICLHHYRLFLSVDTFSTVIIRGFPKATFKKKSTISCHDVIRPFSSLCSQSRANLEADCWKNFKPRRH